MTIAKKIYNKKGRPFAQLFVPTVSEKAAKRHSKELAIEVEKAKRLNQELEEKLKNI